MPSVPPTRILIWLISATSFKVTEPGTLHAPFMLCLLILLGSSFAQVWSDGGVVTCHPTSKPGDQIQIMKCAPHRVNRWSGATAAAAVASTSQRG